MTQRTTNSGRELAHRAGGGIDVSMCWDQRANQVTVKVYDAQADDGFEVEVDGRSALDAYNHPFAYATDRRTRKKIPPTGTEAAWFAIEAT